MNKKVENVDQKDYQKKNKVKKYIKSKKILK